MDYYSAKISKTEWNAYFDWYFEASEYHQHPKIASLQSRILRSTEANKQLRKDKVTSEASCSSFWLLMIRLHLPFCTTHLLYTLSSPILILSLNCPISLKHSPLPFPLNLSEPVLLKLSLLRTQRLNPEFLIFPGLKVNYKP